MPARFESARQKFASAATPAHLALASRGPPHPGEFLDARYLKPLAITQTELAAALGISRRRVNELVNGRRGVTPDTAVRLAMYFGNDAAFWMHLQVAWDMHAAVHEFASGNPRHRQRPTGDPPGRRTANALTQRRGNAMTTFESFGDAGRIESGMRMECELCGYCYDPDEGDVDGQIPEGTTFEALPPHWTCPNCSASKSNFVVVHDE